MKPTELRDISTEELSNKEQEIRESVFRMRFKLSTGELEDTSKIKQSKKDIARIKTIMSERNRKADDGSK